MKIIKLIRAIDWWEYKIPPILVVPYFIILSTNLGFKEALSILSFILLSLVIGAIYVSLLNNITDLEEDKLAGKSNKMGDFRKSTQIIMLLIPLLIGFVLVGFMIENCLASLFSELCFFSFTLYSLSPFRLKKRGLAGVFADALGSQLFPSLFAMTYISAHTNYELTALKFTLVSIWSLCFGLRGILWHQFHDLENDLKSGLYTIVQNMSSRTTKIFGLLLIVIELLSLLGLLTIFGGYYFYFSLLAYFLYLFLYQRRTNVQIIILNYKQQNYCIFMNEYYQVILPIFTLLILTFVNPIFFFLLLIHILFFPLGLYRMVKNVIYNFGK